MDWGEYDIDVVTPSDNGKVYLAKAIEAQGDKYVDFFTPPDMGFNQPTYTVQELEQDLACFDRQSGQSHSEIAAYSCPYLDIEPREESKPEEIGPPKWRCLDRRAIIKDKSD